MITQKFSGGIMLTFAQIKLELPESSDSARQVTRQVAGQVMVFNRLIHTIIKFWMGRVSGGVRRVDKRPEARIHRCMVQVPPSRSLTLRITLVRRIFVTGIQFFRRTEKTFADVI